MDSMLRGSLPAKIGYAFRRAWQGSALNRFFHAVGANYEKSKTRRVLHRFLSVPSTLVYSRYYRVLNAVNGWFFRIGERLRPAIAGSAVFRACTRLTHSAFVENSAVLRTIRNLGMRGILIIAFGMYLPLDVLIRDVVGIDLLSSVWDEVFMLFCIGYIIWDMIVIQRERRKPRATPLDAPVLFFMGAGLLVMAVVSPQMSIAIAGYRAVCQFMLWFFVLTRLISGNRELRIFYYSICVMAVGVALHGIYQYIVGVEIPKNWVAVAEMGVRTRVFSITGSPNIMGALMVMCAPMVAALIYYVKPLWLKCVMWGGTLACCLAALFTFSRGAWLGLAVAILLFGLIVDRKILLLALVAAGGLLLFVPEISNRIAFLFTSDFVEANQAGGRAQRWSMGWMLLSTNPVFGYGLGRFGGAIAMQNQVVDGLNYFYMDNYYMKTLVEMGYVGLISYLYLLASNLLFTVRGLFKTRKDRMSILSRGMFCGMMGVLTHSFFENIFEVPYMNAYFWGMAAAIMFISYLRRKNAAERTQPAKEGR